MPPGIDVCMVLFCNQVETAAAKVKMEPPSAVQPPKKRGVFTVNLKDFSCTMHGFGEPERHHHQSRRRSPRRSSGYRRPSVPACPCRSRQGRARRWRLVHEHVYMHVFVRACTWLSPMRTSGSPFETTVVSRYSPAKSCSYATALACRYSA